MTQAESHSSKLPAVLQAALREGRTLNAAGEETPLHSNVSVHEAESLYRAVTALRPQTSVEIGFALGVSATAILQGLADAGDGRHHIIDPFQERFGDAGLAMVERAGLSSRMQFHRQFAEEVVPGLPALQFAFIDSSHLFDLTIHEFVMVDKKLDDGGVIAFHDLWMPSLQKFIRHLLANRSYRVRRDFQPEPEALSWKQRGRIALGRIAGGLPAGNRVFSPEFLQPWPGFRLGNLVFLEKTGIDQRDWQFHANF
jgi:predicted O-methyltransferase YrrM